MLSSSSVGLDGILVRIDVLRHHAPTTVLLTGYWDIWEDGQVAAAAAAGSSYVTTGDLLTRWVNQRLKHAAALRRATYVDPRERSAELRLATMTPGCWPTTGTIPTQPGTRSSPARCSKRPRRAF